MFYRSLCFNNKGYSAWKLWLQIIHIQDFFFLILFLLFVTPGMGHPINSLEYQVTLTQKKCTCIGMQLFCFLWLKRWFTLLLFCSHLINKCIKKSMIYHTLHLQGKKNILPSLFSRKYRLSIPSKHCVIVNGTRRNFLKRRILKVKSNWIMSCLFKEQTNILCSLLFFG